jgi:hypothetical protein
MDSCASESIKTFESVAYVIDEKRILNVKCYPDPVITFNPKALESPSAVLKYSGKVANIIHSSIYATNAKSINAEKLEVTRKINSFGLRVVEHSFYSTSIARVNPALQVLLIDGVNGTFLLFGQDKKFSCLWASPLEGWTLVYRSSSFFIVREDKWINIEDAAKSGK